MIALWCCRTSLVAVMLSACLSACSTLWAAERALIIGIDTYAAKRSLHGAVADARDLAAAMTKRGIADVRILTDHSATHADFLASWQSLAMGSMAGDTIILTFAGHGSRVTSKKGLEKGFLLQPYDESTAPGEIIRDEELYDLFRPLSERGVIILFIADACHAGAAIRGPVDIRAAGRPVRFEAYDTVSEQAVPLPPSIEDPTRPPLGGVAVFSATDERHTISEAVIDGQPRGALSWAVARAFETDEADATQDGIVSAGELQNFVAPLVRSLPERQQIPQFRFLDRELGLFHVGPEASSAEAVVTPRTDTLVEITLAVVGPGAQDLQVAGAVLSQDRTAAELIFDPARRELLNGVGDVIASGIDRLQLAEAVRSRQVLRELIGLSMKLPPLDVRLSLAGGGRTTDTGLEYFLRGEVVEFSLERSDRPYVTVFDLNADGTVYLLWPVAERGDTGKASGAIRFRAPVAPPYGFDTVVFLSSDAPLSNLHAELRSLDGKAEPLRLRAAVKRVLDTTPLSIGMQSQLTCFRLMENRQCDTMLSSVR